MKGEELGGESFGWAANAGGEDFWGYESRNKAWGKEFQVKGDKAVE